MNLAVLPDAGVRHGTKKTYLLKAWEKCKANSLFRFQGNRIFFMGIKSDRKRHIQENVILRDPARKQQEKRRRGIHC